MRNIVQNLFTIGVEKDKFIFLENQKQVCFSNIFYCVYLFIEKEWALDHLKWTLVIPNGDLFATKAHDSAICAIQRDLVLILKAIISLL